MIQKILLFLYSKIGSPLIERIPFLEPCFQFLYFQYKRFLEDAYYAFFKKYDRSLKPGYIIDVGANIGYTTWVFAQFLKDGKKILSFEPEEENTKLLRKLLHDKNLEKKVIVYEGACGEQDGTIQLWKNKDHHADHRVMTAELKQCFDSTEKFKDVPLHSLDSVAKKNNILTDISFIKIDVQGFEIPVVKGMKEIISHNPDLVVAFEYSFYQMKEMGFNPVEIFTLFEGMNLYFLKKNGSLELITDMKKLEEKTQNEVYFDLIATKMTLPH